MSGYTPQAAELVPGKLYALGANIPLDGRVAWAAQDFRGFQPSNCYLLLEGNAAIMVDTALASVGDDIVRQLESLVPPGSDLSIVLTRAEFECIGNLPRIAERYRIRQLHAGGSNNPFDQFDMVRLFGTREAAVPELVSRVAGDALRLGNGRILQFIAPPIRMLPTYWLYDTKTRALFTSDCFTHVPVHAQEAARVSMSTEDLQSPAETLAWLRAKFWWIGHSRKGQLAAGVRRAIDAQPIDMIAPSYGSVLMGEKVVAEQVRVVLRALP